MQFKRARCPSCATPASLNRCYTIRTNQPWACRGCEAILRKDGEGGSLIFDIVACIVMLIAIALALLGSWYSLLVGVLSLPLIIVGGLFMHVAVGQISPQCPACTYNLRGSLEQTNCPECGGDITEVVSGHLSEEAVRN